MTAIGSRRERLTRHERIGFLANQVAQTVGALAAFPMPMDLAQRIEAFVAAARDVAELTEREIRDLEGAADWAEGSGA